jgi:hypothetical protein
MSKCGCGRSPTGMCKGWHGLSQEEFEAKLKEHQENAKGSPRLWILYFVLFRCDHIQWRHRILERSARGDKFCRNCGPRNRFLDWYYQMATPSNQEVEPKAKQE